MKEREGYNVTQFAEAWGISRPTAYRVINRPGFPKITIGRRIVIPAEASRRWMERQAEEGEAV